jgi:uncharacterized protein YbaR (Trm112 family)
MRPIDADDLVCPQCGGNALYHSDEDTQDIWCDDCEQAFRDYELEEAE